MSTQRITELERSLAELYNQLEQPPAQAGPNEQLQGLIHGQEHELSELMFAQIAAPARRWSEGERKQALAELALARWFTLPMLEALWPERSPTECSGLVGELQRQGFIEDLHQGHARLRVMPDIQAQHARLWLTPERRAELATLSLRLSRYCAGQAEQTNVMVDRIDWRCEQLFHLAAAAPGEAVALMDTWFDEADAAFDLSRAHCWLRTLEERRELLATLALPDDPSQRWLVHLVARRDYLAARTFWSEQWQRTISYIVRDTVKLEIDRFFAPTSTAWLMLLHGPPGHGKTAAVNWLLARYAVPQGHTCARFDYDAVRSRADQYRYVQYPELVLGALAQSLNDQRPPQRRVEALMRQDESGDRAAGFADVLAEVYEGRPVILFVDTLEVIQERFDGGATNLERLLGLLRRMRRGDQAAPGAAVGYPNLRVVLSGRQRLLGRYGAIVDRVLEERTALVEVELRGFSHNEGRAYLNEKRKFNRSPLSQLIEPILSSATEQPGTNEDAPRIVPLKLAMYADMVRDAPSIKPEDLEDTGNIGLLYLVERIIKRIDNLDLPLLLRYGVIFRSLDVKAAQSILAGYIASARRNQLNQDRESDDLPPMRAALADSRRQASEPVPIKALFEELTRYSWVEQVHAGDAVTIRFNRLVWEPQIRALASKPIFVELQREAFRYFAERLRESTDPTEQAAYLREALYHAFLMRRRREAVAFWREQLAAFRSGPLPLLDALYNESFETSEEATELLKRDDRAMAELLDTSVLAGRALIRHDRMEAGLALAEALLAATDQPQDHDKLARAQELAREALGLASGWAGDRGRFRAYTVLAQASVGRRELQQALHCARDCVRTAARLGAAESALAHRLLSTVERANSQWPQARMTIREAYELASRVADNEPNNLAARNLLHQIRLDLIDQLLDCADWPDAIVLVAEARRQQHETPRLLALAARAARLQGRLGASAELYQRAARLCEDADEAARFQGEADYIRLIQGEAVELGATESLEHMVAAAVARGDWTGLIATLKARQRVALPAVQLEATNLLLQYYLEIDGNWPQIDAQLRHGHTFSATLAPSDPQVSRFQVLVQYESFLRTPLRLQPREARRECALRLREVERLPTPEDRVRAKALLLLVRFFGQVEPGDDEQQREAAQIYHACAADALRQALGLLLRLPPFDKVDVMRTLAVLPGWSSRLLNVFTLDPAECNALGLLGQPQPSRPPLLIRLASEAGDELWSQLNTLVAQVHTSESDWPLLFSSCARLLGAFGARSSAASWLQERLSQRRVGRTLAVNLDRIWLAAWPDALRKLNDLIDKGKSGVEARPQLLYTAAFLCLVRGRAGGDLVRAAALSAQLHDALGATQSGSAWLRDAFLLSAVANLELRNLEHAVADLKAAHTCALRLGDVGIRDQIERRWRTLGQAYTQRVDAETRASSVLATAIKHGEEALGGAPLTDELPSDPLGAAPSPRQTVVVRLPQDAGPGIGKRSEAKSAQHAVRSSSALFEWHSVTAGTAPTTMAEAIELLVGALSSRRSGAQSHIAFGEQLGALLAPALAAQLGPDWALRGSEGAEPPLLRICPEGPLLEMLPWGLARFAQAQQGIAQRFCYTCWNPLPHQQPFAGAPLRILASQPATGPEATYRQGVLPPGPQLVVSQDHWELAPDDRGGHIKLVHLLVDLHQSYAGGEIVLRVERPLAPRTKGPPPSVREVDLSPDMLASRLGNLKLLDALLVLEARTTGVASEDLRVLLLRNSYAVALARFGVSVLALGPRPVARLGHSPVDALLWQLGGADGLAPAALELLVQAARLQLLGGEDWIEGQVELYYPATASSPDMRSGA